MLGYMYDVGWYVYVRACVYSYDGVRGCGKLVCTRHTRYCMMVDVCCNVCRSLQYVHMYLM
jgi:hypothetical protein